MANFCASTTQGLTKISPYRNFQLVLFFLICAAGGLTLWINGLISTALVLRKSYLNHDLFNASLEPSSSPPPSPSPTPSSFSDLLFPVPPEGGFYDPLLRENNLMLHSLFHCMEHGTCRKNQTKVIILASAYFRDYLYGSRGGESTWAYSTTQALESMGYTLIYTPFPSLQHAQQYHNMFPDMVKTIIMDDGDARSCYDDFHGCSHSDYNPTGIPSWKILSFVFWPGPHHPLGAKWTLSPEDYASWGKADNTYLGYSVEEACREHPVVPASQRLDQVYILAKRLSFFTPERENAWNTSVFDAVTEATGVQFIMAYEDDTREGNKFHKAQLPSHHVNLGPIDSHRFRNTLSRTRALLGLGNPVLSPSPYDALCLGVPFINPIMDWDRENPSDKSKWRVQHNGLRDLDQPYVYHVFKDDTEGLVQAVKDAIAHPIESYVFERMTTSAVQQRLGAILETDWLAEANQLDIKF